MADYITVFTMRWNIASYLNCLQNKITEIDVEHLCENLWFELYSTYHQTYITVQILWGCSPLLDTLGIIKEWVN